MRTNGTGPKLEVTNYSNRDTFYIERGSSNIFHTISCNNKVNWTGYIVSSVNNTNPMKTVQYPLSGRLTGQP